MAAHLTAEEKTERDELVAGLLAAAPAGLTEYEIGRRIRARTGQPGQGLRNNGPIGGASLRRLAAAGRARCVTEPHSGPSGSKRVWYPIEERS